MSASNANEDQSVTGQALVARARLFREQHAEYMAYVDAARDGFVQSLESRMQELRADGVVGEGHDHLLNQIRGLRSRFAEVDAISRSLLLQIENGDSRVWEEVLASIGAMLSLEYECRIVQERAALAAIIREYVGGHKVGMRRLTLDVNTVTAKRFHGLTTEVREIQKRTYGRQDSFTPQDLFERLLALGDANRDLIARLGTPTLFHVDPMLAEALTRNSKGEGPESSDSQIPGDTNANRDQ